MNPSLLRLAADMLDQYAETLSRNGCNDWKPPTYLTGSDLEELALLGWEANGKPKEEDPKGRVHQDFVVAFALAHMINGLLHERQQELLAARTYTRLTALEEAMRIVKVEIMTASANGDDVRYLNWALKHLQEHANAAVPKDLAEPWTEQEAAWRARFERAEVEVVKNG